MVYNYIKIAWRYLKNKPGFGIVNITGLTLGLCCVLFTYMYITDEMRYDQFHTHAERIFQVGTSIERQDIENHYALISRVAGEFIEGKYPEIELQSLVQKWKPSLKFDNAYFNSDQLLFVEPGFLGMFSYDVLEGNPKKGLTTPFSIVLTESMRKRYFGDQRATDQEITINDTLLFKVAGVIADPPLQSHLKFDALVSYATQRSMTPTLQDWTYLNNFLYVQLKDKGDAAELNEKLVPLPMQNFSEELEGSGMHVTLGIDPLTDLHLRSKRTHTFSPTGDIRHVWTFSIIALCIIFLAVINYVNLNTARAVERAREVGVRKVCGTSRGALIMQFLMEAVVISTFALLLCAVVMIVLLPGFNMLSGKQFTRGDLFSADVLLTAALVTAITGLLSGLYPAFVLSSLRPSAVLKGAFKSSMRGQWLRRGLVVLQFVVSTALIVCSLTAFRQTAYMINKDPGFAKDQILVLNTTAVAKDKLNARFPAFKNAASGSPLIQSVALSSSVPGKGTPHYTVYPEGIGEGETRAIWIVAATPEFPETYGLQMLAGRQFTLEQGNDAQEGLLINASVIKEIGWEGGPQEAVGKRIAFGEKNGVVVGVFEDFHYFSMKSKLGPLLIHMEPAWYNYISISVASENMPNVIGTLETLWAAHFPEYNFSYFFLDEDFETQYASDLKLLRLIAVFTFIGIAIAIIGLIGLTAYSVLQRMKEIGVRKVFGATAMQLSGLLGREMTYIVLIAFVLGSAIGYYLMQKWLSDFPYRTSIGLQDFILVGVMCLGIAWLFTAVIIFRAARKTPSYVLRHE